MRISMYHTTSRGLGRYTIEGILDKKEVEKLGGLGTPVDVAFKVIGQEGVFKVTPNNAATGGISRARGNTAIDGGRVSRVFDWDASKPLLKTMGAHHPANYNPATKSLTITIPWPPKDAALIKNGSRVNGSKPPAPPTKQTITRKLWEDYTPAEKAALVASCEGLNDYEVGDKLGCSHQTIYNWRRKARESGASKSTHVRPPRAPRSSNGASGFYDQVCMQASALSHMWAHNRKEVDIRIENGHIIVTRLTVAEEKEF